MLYTRKINELQDQQAVKKTKMGSAIQQDLYKNSEISKLYTKTATRIIFHGPSQDLNQRINQQRKIKNIIFCATRKINK